MANNKDFKVKNGIQPTVYHEGVGSVTSGSTTTGYNTVDNWAYDSVSFSVSSQSTDPYGVAFKSDGTKMYIAELSGDRIYQYSLSTAYDISTASYDSVSLNTSSQDNPVDVIFKPDGTKLYICGSNNSNIYQYSLSTAWDLSTASYDSVTFSTSSQDIYPYGITFNNDGTKIFLVGNQNNRLYQYSLSTAYDISTMSYSSQYFSFSSQDSGMTGISFNSDGTKMYAVGFSSDTVYQYSLSTAYDVTSISYDSLSFSVSSQDSQPWSIVFNSDGSKGYVVGHANDTIYQYSTGSTLTTNTLDLSTGSVFEITPTSDIQIGLSNPAASGTVSAATLLLDGAANVTPYDLANAAYDSISLNVGTQGLNPYGLTFGDSGTKMYSLSFANDTVFQYTLSTAWDLSTASYAFKSFSVTSTSPEPQALRFSSDGTKFYVTDNNAQEVNQYNCSTAWDVSTASHATVFSTSSQGSEPAGLDFKTDGTKMYVAFASGTDSIAEYNLSTAWDLSTASYSQNSTTINTTPNTSGIMFKNDGTVLYTTSRFTTDAINEYSLSTAWDVSTLSYVQNFLVGTEDNDPTDLYIKPDGTKMYMVGYSTDYVYQYSLASSVGYTITYDTPLQWSGGTAPDSPAIGETDVLTFTTRDGGTTYQAAIAIDGAA